MPRRSSGRELSAQESLAHEAVKETGGNLVPRETGVKDFRDRFFVAAFSLGQQIILTVIRVNPIEREIHRRCMIEFGEIWCVRRCKQIITNTFPRQI